MKKKSPRGIPDFSSKKQPRGLMLPKAQKEQPAPPAIVNVKIKPPATSMKSGRRGS